MRFILEKVENITVIALAGGSSSRMNFPKPWLIFENNTTFLETIINKYTCAGFKKIVILLNKTCFLTKYADKIEALKIKATIIENNYPEKGRLYSLHLALKELKGVNFAIIQNVDNPFVEEEIIKKLVTNRNFEGATIPSFYGKSGHPIIINKEIITEIINNFEKYETLKEVINKFNKKYIEVNSSRILTNINTPQDYKDVMNELV